MTRDPPDAVHCYYASQLGILGSLHKTKALSCPVALTVRKKVLKGSQGEDVICQSPIGLPRTVRIQHLLEDLHFHKSQIDPASKYVCIWRVARLIAASTFCSKHNPWDFEAPFEERFAAIRGKALACPPFEELPHAVAPQTLMGSKRARVDESYPATPSPPKRARSSRAESHLPCQTLGLAKHFDATAGFQMNDATGGYGGLYGGGLPVDDDLFSYDGEVLSLCTQTLLSTPPEPTNATTTMQSVAPQHPQQMTPVGDDLFSYDDEVLSLCTQTLLSTPAEPMNATTTMQSVHPPQHPQQMTPPSPLAEKLARINVAPEQSSQPTSSVSSAGQWDQSSQSTGSVSSELSSWDEAEWLQWESNEWSTVGPEENSC